jgi:hypothetical protein
VQHNTPHGGNIQLRQELAAAQAQISHLQQQLGELQAMPSQVFASHIISWKHSIVFDRDALDAPALILTLPRWYADHAQSYMRTCDESKNHMLSLLAQADADKTAAEQAVAATATAVASASAARQHPPAPQHPSSTEQQLRAQLHVSEAEAASQSLVMRCKW